MSKKPVYKTSEQLLRDKSDRAPRSANIARDDKQGDVRLGLLEIDSAIKYYFDNVIKPVVEENDKIIKVPIIYGSPERWKSIQKDGYYRDDKRKIITPLIMYRRTSIENRRDLARNLDATNPLVYQDFYTRYSLKNKYTPFSVLNNEVPVREFYNVVIPNYVTITYECIIWTDYTVQMNKLIENVNFSDSAYWGEPDKFKFYSVINNYTPSTELSEGEDRLIRTSFEINLSGYIIPDSIQKSLATKSEKGFSISKVFFDINADAMGELATGSADDPTMRARFDELNYTPPPVSGVGGHVSQDIIDYLNTNTQKVADTVTADDGTWLSEDLMTAPDDLPATSLDNFDIFINGQFISDSHIVSFQEVGADVVVVFNTGSLGYELDVADQVVGVGPWL